VLVGVTLLAVAQFESLFLHALQVVLLLMRKLPRGGEIGRVLHVGLAQSVPLLQNGKLVLTRPQSVCQGSERAVAERQRIEKNQLAAKYSLEFLRGERDRVQVFARALDESILFRWGEKEGVRNAGRTPDPTPLRRALDTGRQRPARAPPGPCRPVSRARERRGKRLRRSSLPPFTFHLTLPNC